MTTEVQQTSAPGFTRRTAMKAAAWSVPVIAAATAVPAYAASSMTVDLKFEGPGFGESFTAYSPDGTRQCLIPHVTPMLLSNVGTVDVAAGSLLTLSYDARYFGEAGASIGDTPLPAAGAPTTVGNVTTASFTLPAFPAGGDAVRIDMGAVLLHERNALPWFEDVENASMIATPAGATDANPANNTIIGEPLYTDVADLEMTAVTWGTDTVANAQDPSAPFEVDVPTAFTVTSLSGGITTRLSLMANVARATDAAGSGVGDLVESINITRADLAGTDVRSKISQPYENAPHVSVAEGIELAAGQTLEVDIEVNLISTPVGGVTNNGGASMSVSTPTDNGEPNNTRYSPKHPNA